MPCGWVNVTVVMFDDGGQSAGYPSWKVNTVLSLADWAGSVGSGIKYVYLPHSEILNY